MKIKKSAVKAALKSNGSISDGSETVIEVNMEVGFGNSLYLRGQGAGLTWDRGVPLACMDGKTWRWSQRTSDPICFKVLINDKVWSAGNDVTATPGQTLRLSPSFA